MELQEVIEMPNDWPANYREQRIDKLYKLVVDFCEEPSNIKREQICAFAGITDINEANGTGLLRFTDYEISLLNSLYFYGRAMNFSLITSYIYYHLKTYVQSTRLFQNIKIEDKIILPQLEDSLKGLIPELIIFSSTYLDFKDLGEENYVKVLSEYISTIDDNLAYIFPHVMNVIFDISMLKNRELFGILNFTSEQIFILLRELIKIGNKIGIDPNTRPHRGMLCLIISNIILNNRNCKDAVRIHKFVNDETSNIIIHNSEIWMQEIANLNDDREGKVIEELFEDESWIENKWATKFKIETNTKTFVSCFSNSQEITEEMKEKYGANVWGYKTDRIAEMIAPYQKENGLVRFTTTIAYDVIYSVEEAKKELDLLLSIIDIFDISDSEKKQFLNKIIRYWQYSFKDEKWKDEKERRYQIFLYDDANNYINANLENNTLKIKTTIFNYPDFVSIGNIQKNNIEYFRNSKLLATNIGEYYYCSECLNTSHSLLDKKCEICGSDFIITRNKKYTNYTMSEVINTHYNKMKNEVNINEINILKNEYYDTCNDIFEKIKTGRIPLDEFIDEMMSYKTEEDILKYVLMFEKAFISTESNYYLSKLFYSNNEVSATDLFIMILSLSSSNRLIRDNFSVKLIKTVIKNFSNMKLFLDYVLNLKDDYILIRAFEIIDYIMENYSFKKEEINVIKTFVENVLNNRNYKYATIVKVIAIHKEFTNLLKKLLEDNNINNFKLRENNDEYKKLLKLNSTVSYSICMNGNRSYGDWGRYTMSSLFSLFTEQCNSDFYNSIENSLAKYYLERYDKISQKLINENSLYAGRNNHEIERISKKYQWIIGEYLLFNLVLSHNLYLDSIDERGFIDGKIKITNSIEKLQKFETPNCINFNFCESKYEPILINDIEDITESKEFASIEEVNSIFKIDGGLFLDIRSRKNHNSMYCIPCVVNEKEIDKIIPDSAGELYSELHNYFSFNKKDQIGNILCQKFLSFENSEYDYKLLNLKGNKISKEFIEYLNIKNSKVENMVSYLACDCELFMYIVDINNFTKILRERGLSFSLILVEWKDNHDTENKIRFDETCRVSLLAWNDISSELIIKSSYIAKDNDNYKFVKQIQD